MLVYVVVFVPPYINLTLGTGPDSWVQYIDTLLYYLENGNEQGKKIAMYTLVHLSLFDPDVRLIQAVNQLELQNTRVDTRKYIQKFNSKFSYVIEPEQYQPFVPDSWNTFQENSKSLSLDFQYGEENRQMMKEGDLVYVLNQVRRGKVQLQNLSSCVLKQGDLILWLHARNDIGILTDVSGGMKITFGGYGIHGTEASTLKGQSDLKKIERVT